MPEIPAHIVALAAEHGYTTEDIHGAARFVAHVHPAIRAKYATTKSGPAALFSIGLKHVRARRLAGAR